MYRAVAILAKSISSERQLEHALRDARIDFDERGGVCLNGVCIQSEIGQPEIALKASELSALPFVREHLVAVQREIGKLGAVVLEGRDIGTVVFPDAELKVFLVADASARAERRLHELEASGQHLELEEMKRQLIERDTRDRERTISPLVKASDAIELDTTHLTIEEQVARVVTLAKARIAA